MEVISNFTLAAYLNVNKNVMPGIWFMTGKVSAIVAANPMSP